MNCVESYQWIAVGWFCHRFECDTNKVEIIFENFHVIHQAMSVSVKSGILSMARVFHVIVYVVHKKMLYVYKFMLYKDRDVHIYTQCAYSWPFLFSFFSFALIGHASPQSSWCSISAMNKKESKTKRRRETHTHTQMPTQHI